MAVDEPPAPMTHESKRVCPYCKQEYSTKIGVQNWKRLFRKPTLDDIITLFIIAMVIAAYFFYQADTATCRAVVANFSDLCMRYASSIVQNATNVTESYLPVVPLNITFISDDQQNKTNNTT